MSEELHVCMECATILPEMAPRCGVCGAEGEIKRIKDFVPEDGTE